MNPLLEQFLNESRDGLQGIAEKLMLLESDPANTSLMNDLFRLVHTLKGNSGLFDFPEMTRVLHAGEDLMDAVRDGRVAYSQVLADRLLDAMDFVGQLVDEIEGGGAINAGHSTQAVQLAEAMRQLIGTAAAPAPDGSGPAEPEGWSAQAAGVCQAQLLASLPLDAVPENLRMELYRKALAGGTLLWIDYTPEGESFFKGEDPFFLSRQIPSVVWARVSSRQAWPALAELDPYNCQLVFQALSTGDPDSLAALFRYVPEQVQIVPLPPIALALPQGDPNGGPVYDDFVVEALERLEHGDVAGVAGAARTMLELSAPGLWLSSALRWLRLVLELEPANRQAQCALIESLRSLTAPAWGAISGPEPEPVSAPHGMAPPLPEDLAWGFHVIMEAQREVLSLSDGCAWLPGRLRAVAASLTAIHHATGKAASLTGLDAALAGALKVNRAAPLLAWLDGCRSEAEFEAGDAVGIRGAVTAAPPVAAADEGEGKFGRRAEDAYSGPKTLKVEQAKVDHLMNLIGEMVVAKNSLPYLAGRAETQYGVRELAREIKSQYAVINRIAEEMQDAIMQVRMMAVSFIFQRFPRLVRDLSRKLGKEINLVLEGEDTEADKNIIEALADPLIHIVRNSLDHGIELPEVRRANGKSGAGQIRIRASQESDRVLIEIADDGKGIDPDVIKQKAYEKGLIDEAMLDRLTDQDAINLVFAAGFSTAETISDLSGRGVGMDVVRNAVEKVNGTVSISSELGRGTRIQLSLPLSMAVTNVMVIESGGQIFGVPMDVVVETVRVPRTAIHTIKQRQTSVLRGRIVPLMSLNELLAVNSPPQANDDDEFATLVVRIPGGHLGIIVDDFRETVEIILKPMTGILGGLGGYSGSALLGDGTVLMVLNPRELV